MKKVNQSRTLAARLFAAGILLASAAGASAATLYVDVNSSNATPPYPSWATAATNIQDAVDAAAAGDEVVVTNGVFQTGTRDVYGMSNRVAVTKALVVRSVNGPAVTTIAGSDVRASGVAVRCVYLTNAAVLTGFTLATGSALPDLGDDRQHSGGGVWCESVSAVVNNCVLLGNWAHHQGGGAFSGTLNGCILKGNSALGSYDGYGGGAAYATLHNCTLTGNSASSYGGGAFGGTLNNCIVCFNYSGGNTYSSSLNNCWTTDPLFVDTNGWANLRLQPNSPCINAGNNSYVTNATDFEGNPRISGGVVDIGAYEFQWPQLTITPSAANVVLTWPTNNAGYDYTDFTLQSTTNLVSPVVWTTNSPAPVVIAGQYTVTNPNTGAQTFYRLVQ